MTATAAGRLAYRLFGRLAGESDWLLGPLARGLPQARIRLRPEVYLASAFLRVVIAFVWGLVTAGMVHAVVQPSGGALVFIWSLPFSAAVLTFGFSFLAVWNRRVQRRKQIDARLPYALNYISTMASAGMAPERIFRSLGRQKVYGEVAEEAALISRDLTGLGMDLGEAFRRATARTPSTRMAAFLQGAATTLATGDDLAHYFLVKSRQLGHENRQDERRFLQTLGVLAESYVTLIVAGPIFLLVLLSVMIVFGGAAGSVLTVGYVLVLVLVPTAQAAFAATLESVTPEV